uniref:Uncharacterized protein n=1 Tax=Noctiluca scintillans TaxID=2966 RepID=A0A7S1A955_NOCSC|mmetsp:Transcript_36590/g.97559  ORF Transcript_36590/g.97559 Transcript_36590/m.97559 type:complete len:363 (+) Transcript_36590:94-1182(+)
MMAASPQMAPVSPLMAPVLSPTLRCRKRPRDKDTLFEVDEENAVQAAVDESFRSDIKLRLETSLQETLADLHNEFPETIDNQDFGRARRKSSSALSGYAQSKASPIASLRPSPTFSPKPASAASARSSSPPPLVLPASEVSGPTFDPSEFLCHDGLLDHEQLTRAIYLSQGLDFDGAQNKAQEFLHSMGLRILDLGVVNTDEHGNVLLNQCFYLSIARCYLGHTASEDVSGLALHLKRAIEANVLATRPAWAAGIDDESGTPMAFADFLPIMMHAEDANLVAELAVCILDSVAGHVEVYLGPKYADMDAATKERNLILLWYTPGHYQCIVCDDEDGSKVALTYDDFKDMLNKHGITYIETLE